MKRIFIAVILFLIMAMQAYTAEPASLKWDASTGAVDGYVVEWVLTSDLPAAVNWNTKDVGKILIVEDIGRTFGLYPGKEYSFRVYAHNIVGASGFSDVVDYIVPEYVLPENTVIEENITIPGIPKTLILNFNTTQ